MELVRARAVLSGLDKLPSNVVLAIEIACGIVLFGLVGALILVLYRIVTRHKRLLADLGERGLRISRPNVAEVASSTPGKWKKVLRRNGFMPTGQPEGWESLASMNSKSTDGKLLSMSGALPPMEEDDTEHGNTKRNSRPFFRQGSISRRNLQMARLDHKRLSAIVESPRSKASPHTSVTQDQFRDAQDSDTLEIKAPTPIHPPNRAASTIRRVVSSDQLPTQKPKYRFYDLDDRLERNSKVRNHLKSKSNPSLVRTKSGTKSRRPKMHRRSVSLCSQHSGIAPDGPVPPLPEIPTFDHPMDISIGTDQTPSRASLSSLDSTGSSILVTKSSPAVMRSSGGVKLKRGANHQWKNSLVEAASIGPRHRRPSQTSIRSNIAQYSTIGSGEDSFTRDNSANSLFTSTSTNLLSPGELQSAEAIRVSRITGATNSKNDLKVQVLSTPRRSPKPKVNQFGSPVDRKDTALQDVSGNRPTPTRHMSQSSFVHEPPSTRSSNGNPFQFDSTPMQIGLKPQHSVLKGSPSARKGHKRQNCVRISLAPTILGQSSGPPSPYNDMKDIVEESPQTESEDVFESDTPTAEGTRIRIPSTTFSPDLHFDAAKFRESTMTLDDVDLCSSVRLSMFSMLNSSPPPRNPKRASASSSLFSIPPFPEPGRIRAATVIPPPTFAYSQTSADISETTPRACFDLLTQPITPAQLGVVANTVPENGLDVREPLVSIKELDVSEAPGGPRISIAIFDAPIVKGRPETPPDIRDDIFDSDTLTDHLFHDIPISAHVSPKTDPTVLESTRDNLQARAESPTINPLDLIMSSYATSPSITPSPEERTLPIPNANAEAAAQSASQFLDVPYSGSPTSHTTPRFPSHFSQSLTGPRDPPVKPVRDAVVKLRRMNSEFLETHRSDRRYLRLGREASPNLPGESSTPVFLPWDNLDKDFTDGNSTSTSASISPDPNPNVNTSTSSPNPTFSSPIFEDVALTSHPPTPTLSHAKLPSQDSTWDPSLILPSIKRHPIEEEKENYDAILQTSPPVNHGTLTGFGTAVTRQPRRRSQMRKSAILNATMLRNGLGISADGFVVMPPRGSSLVPPTGLERGLQAGQGGTSGCRERVRGRPCMTVMDF